MNAATKEKIEAFLKKAGFYKLSNKDVWVESKCPNQKVVDLTIEPIFVGINTGVQRIEAEDSGISTIQDYKSMIMQIYNSSELNQDKKPPEAGSHNPGSSQGKGQNTSPPTKDSNVAPATPGGESHAGTQYPFICSACETGISAVQRSTTVESCKRALCEACSKIPLAPNAPAKEEPTKLNVIYACYDCQKVIMAEQEGKASEKKYGFPVCKACSEIRDTKASTKETKKKPAGKKKDEKEHKEEKIGEVKETKTPAPEQIKPVMCQDCGFELSHVRALEYQICEECAEKRRIEAEKTIPLKQREPATEKKTMPESKETTIIPAAKPGANAPVPMSDHERDQQIEKAKAKKFLEQQGGSYKVSGKEIPDSARIQNIANDAGVSVQILESEQNENYARVRVRGNLGNQYVDGEVWVDFRTETQLLMMEFINKNKGILDHFDGLSPVLKEGAQIKNYDGTFSDAKYALVHAMLTLRKFAVRTAATKASKIVQMKLLNKEFREIEEVSDEQKEADLVNEKKKPRG